MESAFINAETRELSHRTIWCNISKKLERRNVMYVRKHGKKYQCLVRLKGVSVSQSFVSKSDARLWGQKTEVDISNGVYLVP